MTRVLYLAEPIDQSDYGVWKEGVNTVVKAANDRGWLVYRPSTAWRVHKDARIGPEIEQANRFVLEHAGALVAILPSGVPTVGVPREIEYAAESLIPTLVVSDHQGWAMHDVDVVPIGDAEAVHGWLATLQAIVAMGGPRPLVISSSGGKVPTRSHEGDAGWDLYVSEDVTIQPGDFCDVPCGVRVALPAGVWGRITGRSSTLRKRHLLVAEGVIDNGYRGPLFSGVWNLGSEPCSVVAGERLAQLLLHQNIAGRYQAVEVPSKQFDRIPGDSRGVNGFGSSGD